jgi:hypothetical protein
MNLSHLALLGVIIAFGSAYLSTLRSPARQSSALRFALSLPLLVVSVIALSKPLSVFSLRAIGVQSGAALSGLSLFPQGSEPIEDLTLSFGATQPEYWSFAALGLSLLTLVMTWRDYRRSVKSKPVSRVWSVATNVAWIAMWILFLSQVPVNFGEFGGGEAGIEAFLAYSSQDTPPSAYVIPKEYWVYAPEQWYLVLVALASAGLSLFSLGFKTTTNTPAQSRPAWSAIGAILVLIVLGMGLTDTGLLEQSSLWMATMLLCAVSFLNLPTLQRHVILVSSLVVLVGLY